jgi:hypothetical protein
LNNPKEGDVTNFKNKTLKLLLWRHFCFNKEPTKATAYNKNNPKGLKENITLLLNSIKEK